VVLGDRWISLSSISMGSRALHEIFSLWCSLCPLCLCGSDGVKQRAKERRQKNVGKYCSSRCSRDLSPLWGSRPRLDFCRRTAAFLLAMRWTFLVVFPRERGDSRDLWEIQQTHTQPIDASARSRCSLGRDDKVAAPSRALGMTSLDWRAMNLWSAGDATDA